jgi:methylglutaconyl-CoA hydratase
MAENPVLYDVRNTVAWITINRPDRRNALNDDVVQAISNGIARAVDDQARAIVLTGAGDKAFCAGGDLGKASDAFSYDFSKPVIPSANMMRAAYACSLPIVARVNGHCLAGGMALLGMSDLAVAAETARFGLPEVKVGLFPMQVLAVLQTIIPQRKLAELCLTGEPIDAAEAKDFGLVNYIAPPVELDDKLDWLLSRILDKSPSAQRRGIYAMKAARGMAFSQALAFLESQIVLTAQTEDAKEGRAAFLEKRPPRWTGR